MKTSLLFTASCVLASLFASSAMAETKVTLSGMHLCCGGCVNGVKKAIKDMEGVAIEMDSKAGTGVLTAEDDATAQKALDAIATAGFHAETDSDTLVMKDDSGVKEGELTRLELTGVHNCCGACDRAIKKALADIAGIEGLVSKAKTDKIVVEGKFDGQAVVKALYKEGFHGKQSQ